MRLFGSVKGKSVFNLFAKTNGEQLPKEEFTVEKTNDNLTQPAQDRFKLLREYAVITAGLFLAALAIYFFMMPSNIIFGSITGLAMVLVHFIPVSVSVMTFILNLFCLVIGFVFLVKGADAFVEGCSSVAKRFHVPTLIIGMTIVAMGTSLPETAVSITASISGNNALAVSNAVGSNIFNLMVVVGVCAVLTPLAVQVGILKRDFPLSIACAILLLILGAIDMTLGHVDGVVFIVLFAFFILYMIRSARNAGNGAEGEEDELLAEAEEMPVMSVPKSLIYIVAGGVAIALGSDWVVDGATTVASAMGISQTLIGLTVVAFGTSLPELATSIVAAKKKEVDMALGNVIGSNIFNILMVLGIASAVSPVAFLTENVIDIVILIIFSAIVWVLAWTKKELNRKEGILMLILYAAYVVYICIR